MTVGTPFLRWLPLTDTYILSRGGGHVVAGIGLLSEYPNSFLNVGSFFGTPMPRGIFRMRQQWAQRGIPIRENTPG